MAAKAAIADNPSLLLKISEKIIIVNMNNSNGTINAIVIA
jgi:hypothetical protein